LLCGHVLSSGRCMQSILCPGTLASSHWVGFGTCTPPLHSAGRLPSLYKSWCLHAANQCAVVLARGHSMLPGACMQSFHASWGLHAAIPCFMGLACSHFMLPGAACSNYTTRLKVKEAGQPLVNTYTTARRGHTSPTSTRPRLPTVRDVDMRGVSVNDMGVRGMSMHGVDVHGVRPRGCKRAWYERACCRHAWRESSWCETAWYQLGSTMHMRGAGHGARHQAEQDAALCGPAQEAD